MEWEIRSNMIQYLSAIFLWLNNVAQKEVELHQGEGKKKTEMLPINNQKSCQWNRLYDKY